MKVAVAVWEDSVSTACDFCGCLQICDIEANEASNPILLTFKTRLAVAFLQPMQEAMVAEMPTVCHQSNHNFFICPYSLHIISIPKRTPPWHGL